MRGPPLDRPAPNRRRRAARQDLADRSWFPWFPWSPSDVLDAQDARRAFEERLALDRLYRATHRALGTAMGDDAYGHGAIGLERAAFLHHLLDADAFGAQGRGNVPEHAGVIADSEAQVVA